MDERKTGRVASRMLCPFLSAMEYLRYLPKPVEMGWKYTHASVLSTCSVYLLSMPFTQDTATTAQYYLKRLLGATPGPP